MKKCNLCNEETDIQFMHTYTTQHETQQKQNNIIITKYVLVCDYCDLEHDLEINYNGLTYTR